MRIFALLAATFAAALDATVAHAHPGHLIEAAGHDHWLGAAAIGAAIAIGLWKAAKSRKEAEAAETASDPESEAQEA